MEQEFPTDNSQTNQKEFKFPANIKQMGNADRELKIYLEDYVYTYLYQYARMGGGEKLAVLVGRHFVIDGVDVTVVSGAIEARETENSGNEINFTEESWGYINRQAEIYFKGLCVLGWVHIQPDFGTYLMPSEEAFHKECFKEKWQLLFIMDPSERLDTFYCVKSGDSGLRQVRGYFIYYDKNESMQNYMIENSMIKPRIPQEEEIIAPKLSGKAAVARLLGITRQKAGIHTFEEDKTDGKTNDPRGIDAAVKIRKILRKKEAEKEKESKNKQIALTAVCAALCFASVMMCGNLLSNMVRIRNLESELITMKDSYGNISKMVEDTATQVFAAQNAKAEPQKIQEAVREKPTATVVETAEQNIYWVEEGDSLWYISKMFYGTSEKVELIMDANGLDDGDMIFLGEKLIIPRK